jgi:hypothetical protein
MFRTLKKVKEPKIRMEATRRNLHKKIIGTSNKPFRTKINVMFLLKLQAFLKSF